MNILSKKNGLLAVHTLMICSAIISINTITYAQDQVGDTVGTLYVKPEEFAPLDEYFQEAMENNPQVRELYYSYRAQVANANQMGLLPDPEVNIGYFVNPPEGGALLGRFSVSAMQMFPWPGTLSAQRRGGEYMSEAEYHRIRSQAAAVLRDIHLSWLDYTEYDLSRFIIQENINQIDELYSLMQIRYETARASQADILRLQMERARFKNRMDEVDEERVPIKIRLNALMNRESESEIEGASTLKFQRLDMDEEELLEAVLIQNPDRAIIDANRRQFRNATELARLEGRPQFGIGIEVMGRDFSVMSMMPDMKEGVVAMATIRLPIYRQRSREQRREAEYQILRVEQSNQQLDNYLHTEVSRYFKDKRDAERRINLIQNELIPRAIQAFEILREEYTGGRAGFEELIQIQREVLDLELEELQATISYYKSLAQIEWLMSSELQDHFIEF